MPTEEDFDADETARREKRRENLTSIRDSFLGMAAKTEEVAETGGKYREPLTDFARDYRAKAASFSEKLEALDDD